MPLEWWGAIPSGSFVYWRVRGMDLDARPRSVQGDRELMHRMEREFPLEEILVDPDRATRPGVISHHRDHLQLEGSLACRQ